MQLPLFEPDARINRLIEAGAGTGKTTRLVSDVLRLLLENPDLDASRIVLMTFTDKAAGEIAARIRAAVVQFREILESGGDAWPSRGTPIIRIARDQLPVAREAAVRHSLALDSIRSQTIHSFCQSILARSPLESGLDPRFSIVEGVARTRLLGASFEEWLETELTEPDDETAENWKNALALGRGTAHLRNALRLLHPRRDILSDPSYSLGSFTALAEWVHERFAVLALISDDFVAKKSDPQVAGVVELAREKPPLETSADWDDLVQRIGRLARLNASRLPKDERWAWMELRKIVQERWVSNHRAAIAYRALAVRFFRHFDARKAALGVADFDDLLDRTDRLLAQNDVLAAVSSRYDYFFVDEFQDTDRVQARILDRLARDRDGRLVPGRVTIVGDPKQSIYSFRRAEPEIFHQTVERYAKEGAARESLSTQYRSDPPLVSAVNGMFTALLGNGMRVSSVVQPGYTQLQAGRGTSLRQAAARIRFLGIECSPSDPAVRTEAEGVAEWILQQRDRRESGPDGDLRRFAILLRKMTSASVWSDVFARRGIELAMPPGAELLSRPGSTDLVAVLRSVADPLDRASLFSATRSIFFALPDEVIARGLSGIESEDWRNAMETMRRWRRVARRYGTSATIDAILAETRIDASLFLIHGGDQWMARIHRLRELSAQLEFEQHMSVREFVRELELRRDESAESEPARPEEGRNAVRLMTVHAAKGLEFDTVILAELGAQTQSGSTDAFIVDELGALVMESPSSLNRFITNVDGYSLKDIQARRKTWERDRLFYVAVTRARTDVVFAAPVYDPQEAEGESQVRESNSEFWKPIHQIFGFERKQLIDRLPGSLSEQVEVMSLGEVEVPVAFERLRPVSAHEERPRFTRGFDERLLSDPPSPAPSHVENDELAAGEIRKMRAGMRRRSWGTAVHRALEIWGAEETSTALALRVARERRLDAAETENLGQLLTSIDRSSIWKRIRSGHVIGRELAIVTGGEGGTEVGRIDLLIRERGGTLLVVDYKTGSPEGRRVEEDVEQVRSYCLRVSEMSGQACSGLVWYLEQDRAIEIPPLDQAVVSCSVI